MKKKQLRPVGDIMLDMEKLLEELTDDQDLQWSEVLALVHSWLTVHAPHQQEEYMDGSSPQYYYGPKLSK